MSHAFELGSCQQHAVSAEGGRNGVEVCVGRHLPRRLEHPGGLADPVWNRQPPACQMVVHHCGDRRVEAGISTWCWRSDAQGHPKGSRHRGKVVAQADEGAEGDSFAFLPGAELLVDEVGPISGRVGRGREHGQAVARRFDQPVELGATSVMGGAFDVRERRLTHPSERRQGALGEAAAPSGHPHQLR